MQTKHLYAFTYIFSRLLKLSCKRSITWIYMFYKQTKKSFLTLGNFCICSLKNIYIFKPIIICKLVLYLLLINNIFYFRKATFFENSFLPCSVPNLPLNWSFSSLKPSATITETYSSSPMIPSCLIISAIAG